MKKYVKPELFYERYELTQHIADCSWELKNSSDDRTCNAEPDPDDYPGFQILFHAGQDGCDLTSDKWQDYCYHNGADGYRLFQS